MMFLNFSAEVTMFRPTWNSERTGPGFGWNLVTASRTFSIENSGPSAASGFASGSS